ncbi:biotin/lipoyl-binding protein [Nocardioides hankookensis]
MRETVSADGTLAASRTSDESFAVSGTVTRVAVSEGDKVRKGDVLATVGRVTEVPFSVPVTLELIKA